jgi:hypothetical protein
MYILFGISGEFVDKSQSTKELRCGLVAGPALLICNKAAVLTLIVSERRTG